MYYQYVYTNAHQSALSVLSRMHDSLEKYKNKEGHNTIAAKIQEDNIVELAKYIETAQRTIMELNTEIEASYTAGVMQGKKIAARLRKEENIDHAMYKKSRSIGNNEQKRAYWRNIQEQKWSDHF